MTYEEPQYNTIEDVSPRDKALGYTAAMAIFIYLVWRLGFSLPLSYGYATLAIGILLYICELISGTEAICNYLAKVTPLHLERPDIPDEWYPDIDILIATHDEEINLMYNTINGCLFLNYPDKSKIHIHLCDDGNRPEMRELAERMGINYIDMPVPQHAKAGNMNNAISKTNSPIIAFLDADMIPRREFLMEIVPYFYLPYLKKDEQEQWMMRKPSEIDPEYHIGFVQTPQNFYNPDLFQYNLYAENRLPNEQIYFFREVNVSRNRHNAAHMCGSNMLISRKALAEAGNFATNNITEDHETGMKIQTAGYTTYGLPICLANGLNPPAIVNLIIQRERWGRGAMQTFYNVRPFLDSRIPLVRRFHYLCTLLYWLTFFCRFVYIITPILVAVFGVHIVECSLGELMIFWLPQYLLHVYTMSKLSSKSRTVHWSNTFDTIMFPFLAVPIMLDLIGIRLNKFKVTDKSHQKQTNSHPELALPHILLFVLSVLGIILSLIEIIQYRSFYNIIILFWLFVNSKGLLLAIFFMLGRTNERLYYRFYVSVDAEIEYKGNVFTGKTSDVSEGGFSISLNYPALLPTDEQLTVRLHDRIYDAEMQCFLVQVKRTKNQNWVYSLRVDKIDDHNLSQYRQIIYERDPTLPEAINETLPIIEDIKVNLDKRLKEEPKFFSRKLPRVVSSVTGTLPDGSTVTLDDFSYQYVRVLPMHNFAEDETLEITVEPGISLKIGVPEAHLAAQNRNLFKVLNMEDWQSNPLYIKALAKWAEAVPPVTAEERAKQITQIKAALNDDGRAVTPSPKPESIASHYVDQNGQIPPAPSLS